MTRVSLCGAQQFFTGRARDRGRVVDATGRSLDDPDRDGVIEEITAGDLDLVEWYLLNHPRPAEKPSPGRAIFEALACDRCHVPDWRIDARADGRDYTARRTGDRRFFDLDRDGNQATLTLGTGAGYCILDALADFVRSGLTPA